MPLTANAIPSQVPDFATPYDAMLAFTSAQVIAATGYLNNIGTGQLDLGSSNPSTAAGRTTGMVIWDITNVDISSGDETYRLFLFGSNDVAFGNGNVEQLAFYDIAAATAGRIVPTILGPTPTIPPTGMAGMLIKKPFTTLSLRIVYRYLRSYIVIGGTTPTITVTAWCSFAGVDF